MCVHSTHGSLDLWTCLDRPMKFGKALDAFGKYHLGGMLSPHFGVLLDLDVHLNHAQLLHDVLDSFLTNGFGGGYCSEWSQSSMAPMPLQKQF